MGNTGSNAATFSEEPLTSNAQGNNEGSTPAQSFLESAAFLKPSTSKRKAYLISRTCSWGRYVKVSRTCLWGRYVKDNSEDEWIDYSRSKGKKQRTMSLPPSSQETVPLEEDEEDNRNFTHSDSPGYSDIASPSADAAIKGRISPFALAAIVENIPDEHIASVEKIDSRKPRGENEESPLRSSLTCFDANESIRPSPLDLAAAIDNSSDVVTATYTHLSERTFRSETEKSMGALLDATLQRSSSLHVSNIRF